MAGATRKPRRGESKTQGRKGARRSRVNPFNVLRAWLRHHRLSAAESLQRVLQQPWSSLLTWLVIGIALALPVGLNIGMQNVQALTSEWSAQARISLFMPLEASLETARELKLELMGEPDIESVRLIERDEALAEFGESAGFADVMGDLQENPLPHVLVVTPATELDYEQIGELRQQLGSRAGEGAQAVLDIEWLRRLHSLLDIGRRTASVVGALLVLGVVLVLGNTLRLAIETRREEIVVVKLVGGSDAFVRRPFLYTGLWLGCGGGLFAGLLVAVPLWYLDAGVEELARLYQSEFELQGPGLMDCLNLIVLGGLLGLAGAWLAVARHLAAIQPK